MDETSNALYSFGNEVFPVRCGFCQPFPNLGKVNAFSFSFFFFLSFVLFRATLATYGGPQASGLIGAVAAGLRHSHSNAGSEPCLRPTPQVTATPDP